MRDFLPLIDSPVGDDAEPDVVFSGYLRHYEAAWTCFDDAQEALEEISRLPIMTAVLTNGTDEQQHAKLKAAGPEGRFTHVFTAESLGVAKPDLSTCRNVCEALNVEVHGSRDSCTTHCPPPSDLPPGVGTTTCSRRGRFTIGGYLLTGRTIRPSRGWVEVSGGTLSLAAAHPFGVWLSSGLRSVAP